MMRTNKYPLFLFITFFLFLSCKGKSPAPLPGDALPVQTLSVHPSDEPFDRLDEWLEIDRMVPLADEVPIGEVRRILIQNELIFILDHTPRLFCYNMDGTLRYQIDNKGGGPEEYGNLLDFAVNAPLRQLLAYDSRKRKIIRYDLYSGEFLSALPLTYIAPMHLALSGGAFYFDTPDHFNTPGKKDLYYSLIYSLNGSAVDGRFFPHDPVSEYDFNFGNGHPFYYSNDTLLYNKRFDNLIYRLEAGQVTPCYRFELPEPLPLSLVENKTNPADLIQSRYSWGISDVFVCQDLLYCWFTKAASFQMVFYDLKANKQIYCGRIPWSRPTRKLPLFFPIGGVYRNTFFSVAEPEYIRDKMEKSPELFSAEMKEITEFSNPVILFYKRGAIVDK